MKEEIEKLVPDFYDWPKRWMGMPEDEAYGQRVLEYFEPFVFEVVAGALADKTKKKHIDHLWLAGGEIIREVAMDGDYRIDPKELLLERFGLDGGPYCRHLHSEQEFNSYDSSCRKFYKFMRKCGEGDKGT
jgi:hypothetical protein